MPKPTIGSIIKAGIEAGKSAEAILGDVKAAFPAAETKSASVNWYRSQMKKGGAAVPQPQKSAAAKAVESTVPNLPVYEVKAVRDQEGLEGLGFACSLYRDGRKVADVVDWADGGDVSYVWSDRGAAGVMVRTVDYSGVPREYGGTPEEAMLAAHCLALPRYKCPYDGGMHLVSPDIFVEGLVEDHGLRRQLAKLTKKIAYVTGDGQVYTVSAEPTPENIAKYVTGHNCTVLNGMPEADALVLLKRHNK